MRLLLAVAAVVAVLPWASAQPGVQLVPPGGIPGGSLARAYEQSELYLPGNINKPWLNVLVIVDTLHRPMGLRMAGHAPSAVCTEASRIVSALTQQLEAAGAVFGKTKYHYMPDNLLYSTYGLFTGPVDIRHTEPYAQAEVAFKQLALLDSQQVVVTRISYAEYRSYTFQFQLGRSFLTRFETTETREGTPGIAAVLHDLPDHFWTIQHAGIVQQPQMQALVAACAQAVQLELPHHILEDEQVLRTKDDTLYTVEYPYQYRIWYTEKSPLTTQWADSTTLSIRQLCWRNAEFHSRLESNIQLLNFNMPSSDMHDQVLRELYREQKYDLLLQFGLTNVQDTLLAQVRTLEAQGKQVDSITFEWKQLDPDAEQPLLKAYRAARLELAHNIQQAHKHHPLMLADAIARGWPCLGVQANRNLYALGSSVRDSNSYVKAFETDFFIVNTDSAEYTCKYTTVSGAVVQVLNYRNYESAYVPLHNLFERDTITGIWDANFSRLLEWFPNSERDTNILWGQVLFDRDTKFINLCGEHAIRQSAAYMRLYALLNSKSQTFDNTAATE
jgi:hypothetical protein